ncbi:MAG TPA: selenide, water dikinase SelD [Pyrinomonadaceae bacterium]
MAKLAPRDLAQVLGSLPPQPENKDVLVGYDKADDAGVFRLGADVALVQTVDFFTPVADDPEIYGRVAANNALNDIYAMGGKPITALSIVCYPQKGDWDVLRQILLGGQMAMSEAGVFVLGGHSIDDAEIKFGYAVTGLINPEQVVTNASAQPGDVLILTKPIGTGAISTGIKRGMARPETVEAAMRVMTTSAAAAAEAMQEVGTHACTDVTGFGLLGHAYEMARASEVCLVIEAARVPLLPDVLELISQGMLTRGDKNNREYVGDTVQIAQSVSRELQSALFDPQTAGGLLISLERSRAEILINKIDGAVIIGEVQPKSGHLIQVV